MRTPEELINLYWEEVWNKGNAELIREICSDPLIRHDPDSTTLLSHEDQISRVLHLQEREPVFTHEILFSNDRYVCSVWNMTIRKGERALCGIEVFQVDEGRLSHAWNSAYSSGHWRKVGAPSVNLDLPPPRVLESHDSIDVAWLQSVFQHSGMQVPRIGDLTSTAPIGNGTLSETALVKFGYNAPPNGAPTSVVCKFNRVSPAIDAANKRLRFYEREIETYQLLQGESELPIPKVYFAQMSDDGLFANIVMEDLTQRTVPGDQIKGCSFDESAAVVAALSDLHVRFASMSPPEWVLGRKTRAQDLAASYQLGVSALSDMLGSMLSDQEYAVITDFGDLYMRWATRAAPYQSLLHGDARVDNVLFEHHGSGPIRALLVDWQMTDVGPPAFDLAYFLTGSVDVEVRRAGEDRWIVAHAASLSAIWPTYDNSAAREEFRCQAVAGLAATVAAARTVLPSDQGTQLLQTLAKRNCAAILDWKALDAIRALSPSV